MTTYMVPSLDGNLEIEDSCESMNTMDYQVRNTDNYLSTLADWRNMLNEHDVSNITLFLS
jgi:hypothetical protein